MDTLEVSKKREKEKTTVNFMIEIYCHGKHKTSRGKLCKECQELADYAKARVEHCPHMETKSFCSCCKTHCYKTEMRERIRNVMRFSGPRMIIYCPGLVLRHKLEEIKKK